MSKILNHNLSIVIPVYNGQESIEMLVDSIHSEVEGSFFNLHEILLVDDGSLDKSSTLLVALTRKYPNTVKCIYLYRNFGEHNAVMCGLNHISGDSVAIIDDDFQNPPSEIVLLVNKLIKGSYDIVYSYYEKKQHNYFRNLGSKFNDLCATILLGKPKNLYLSSFKVMDKSLVDVIITYRGPFPYIDGLILRSTTKIGQQLCQHNKREQGKSSYTLNKLVRLWLNMATGFSILPLRIASGIGIGLSVISGVLTIYFLLVRITGPIIVSHEIPPGWASIVTSVTFLSGIQLFLIGVLGEYLGRVLLTLNCTPQYIIRNKSWE